LFLFLFTSLSLPFNAYSAHKKSGDRVKKAIQFYVVITLYICIKNKKNKRAQRALERSPESEDF